MVTKGIIKSIDLNGNTCTVHMPFFETAGNDPIIGTAIISNTPGSYNGYKVGDVVLVAFEDGGMDSPVVMGKLYLGAEAERADPRGTINVESSAVSRSASMPADTKLAAGLDDNVPNTTAPYNSLSSIANELNTLNVDVHQMDRDNGNRFKQVISDIDGTKSELHQTAENMVAKVSGFEYEKYADGELILDEFGKPKIKLDANGQPTRIGFGWELKEDKWKVFSHEKDILIATKDGLKVIGEIEAEKGHLGKFNIGAEHECSELGTKASGIYSDGYIEKYEDTPSTDGVYIGTDGIQLGTNFSINNKGDVIAKSIVAENLAINQGQVIGLPDSLTQINKDISDVDEAAQGYADDAEKEAKRWVEEDVFNLATESTHIANEWISTTTVLAQNLQVKAAKIDGQLTAGQINTTGLAAEKIAVSDASGNNLLYADATKDAPTDNVKIGNFVVDANSISLPTRKADGSVDNKFGANNTVMICTGSDSNANIGGSGNVNGWNFTAGTNFGVRTIKTGTDAGKSEMYASRGKIGGFDITSSKISSGTLGGTNGVYFSNANLKGTLGEGYAENWRVAIGENFGVKNDGTLYCKNGIFDGEITASSCYLNDVKSFNFTGDTFSVGGMSLSNIILSASAATSASVTFKVTSGGAIYEGNGSITYYLKIGAYNSSNQKVALAKSVVLDKKLKSGTFSGQYTSGYRFNKTVTFNQEVVFPRGAKEVTIRTTTGNHTQYGTKDTWSYVQGIFENNSSSWTQTADIVGAADASLLACSGGFVPETTGSGTLGTAARRWGNIYGADLDANNITADGIITATGNIESSADISSSGTITSTGTITTSGNFIAKNSSGTELFSVKSGTVTASNFYASNFYASGSVQFKIGDTYRYPAVRINETGSPNAFWATSTSIKSTGWKSVSLPDALKSGKATIVSVLATAKFPYIDPTKDDGRKSDLSGVSGYAFFTDWDGSNVYVYNPISIGGDFKDYAYVNIVVLARVTA